MSSPKKSSADEFYNLIVELLSKLRFISQYSKTKKINTRNMAMSDDCFLTNCRRWWDGEKRESALQFFDDTVKEALMLIEYCLQKEEVSERDSSKKIHKKIADIIFEALKDVKNSYSELCKNDTYKSDTMFISRVEASQKILDVKMETLGSQLHSLREGIKAY